MKRLLNYFKNNRLFEKIFLRWWLFISVQAVFVFFMQYKFDIFTMIYQDDITLISFFIMGLFVVITTILGIAIYKGKVSDLLITFSWFLADTMMYLGFIGTVIGFIILFKNLPIAESMVGDRLDTLALLSFMLPKMGIALFTTVSGQICSLTLKFQLMNFELGDDEIRP